MARARDVLDQALHLPLKERARVAHELLTSLDEGPAEDPADVERSWAEEIGQRVDAVEAGRAKSVAWSTVEREIRSDLTKIRSSRSKKTRRRSR
jgi:putative addiction module component (TIGR02574 family)